MELLAIDRSIKFLNFTKEVADIDSYIIHTCKYSTVFRMKCWENYKDPKSGFPKTTKKWCYGGKCHITIDVDVSLIMDWLVTKGNIHDSKVSHDLGILSETSHIYLKTEHMIHQNILLSV